MSWLANFILSAGGYKTTDEADREPDRTQSEVGIHVLSFLGDEYRFVSAEITEKLLVETISELDWENEFHQVICTQAPGVTLEVGGSLNEMHGLSSSYRNDSAGVDFVTRSPPESVQQMLEIMTSFCRDDDEWKSWFDFR